VYGIFYDYHTDMADPLKGTYCPSGWRVPTSTEWGELVNGNEDVPRNFNYNIAGASGEGNPYWNTPGYDKYGFTIFSTGEYLLQGNIFRDYGIKAYFLLSENNLAIISATTQTTGTADSGKYYPVRCILVTNP
jgi:uncharacterized protein (TIGR02145 family)